MGKEAGQQRAVNHDKGEKGIVAAGRKLVTAGGKKNYLLGLVNCFISLFILKKHDLGNT